MKKSPFVLWIAAVAVFLVLFILRAPVATAEEDVLLTLNGALLFGDAEPFIGTHGRTMVPMRLVGEALGSKVSWNNVKQEVSVSSGDRLITLWVGKNEAVVDGRLVELDAPPEISSDRTMIPLRFVAEQMGAEVEWDQPKNTVDIRAAWAPVREVVVFGQETVLRKEPRQAAGRLTDLRLGTNLDVLAKYDHWFLVETLNAGTVQQGWVEASDLAISNGYVPVSQNSGRAIAGKLIVLDPGHGNLIQPGNWSNPGAVGPRGTAERDVVMDIAQRTKKLLEAEGAKVILTHSGSTVLDQAGRAQVANRAKADVFVSIHANASVDQSLAGTATYYFRPANRQLRQERDRLASLIQEEMVRKLGRRDIGLIEADFTVIWATKMPSVLLETAFISNPAEELLLADPAFRQQAAQGIFNGLLRYFSK